MRCFCLLQNHFLFISVSFLQYIIQCTISISVHPSSHVVYLLTESNPWLLQQIRRAFQHENSKETRFCTSPMSKKRRFQVCLPIKQTRINLYSEHKERKSHPTTFYTLPFSWSIAKHFLFVIQRLLLLKSILNENTFVSHIPPLPCI